MKVLFCTDGSEASNFAIKKALSILKKDIEIHLLNSGDWGLLPTFITFPYETEVGFPTEKNIGEEILNATEIYINQLGFKVDKKDFLFGPADKVILEQINENKYNVVVMGSHGKKGFSKWLGSISRKVVFKSPIPVIIARPPHKEKDKIETKEILIAADGSACSFNAITKMTELLNMEDSNIEVINVIAGIENLPVEISMDEEWLKMITERQNKLSEEIFDKVKILLSKKGITVKNSIIKKGDAAREILEYIKEKPKLLTISGSHGREGFSDILLGSVSKRILDNAPNMVLIVPINR